MCLDVSLLTSLLDVLLLQRGEEVSPDITFYYSNPPDSDKVRRSVLVHLVTVPRNFDKCCWQDTE